MHTPGFPVLHYLIELAQIQVCWVSDAIQLSHPLPPSFPFGFPSFPALGSFPMSWLFTSDGQSVGAWASASGFPMNIQGWSPPGLTGLISLQSKGFSRVFSCTTVQRHQLPSIQVFYSPTLISIYDYQKNHNFDDLDLYQQSNVFVFQYAV